MKTIREKIAEIIRSSNGFPHFNQKQYIRAIRLLLVKYLTEVEIQFIEDNKINLDNLIIEITIEITDDFL